MYAFCLFGLWFYILVNSYVMSRQSVNLSPFSWASLTKQYFMHILFTCNGHQPLLNQQKEENNRKNVMINLHESMGPAGIKLTAPGSAIYWAQSLCMQAAKVLASLHVFAESSEPLLLDYVISTKISCAGLYLKFLTSIFYILMKS